MTDHVRGISESSGRTFRRLVGDETWADMLERSFERRHMAGDTLLRQGEAGTHVLALRSGLAKVTLREQSGQLTLLAFRGPGELLGEMAVLDGGVRSASVHATSRCSVAVLSKAEFLRFVTHHELFPVLVRYALSRLRESDRARGGGDVLARLTASLVNLADISGHPETLPGQRLELALTRDELAQHLRVSRNTITACLSQLESLHVHLGRKRIFIDDLHVLRQVSTSLNA